MLPETHSSGWTRTLLAAILLLCVFCAITASIAGYHFHFLSEDRTKGGHLLQCSGKNLRVRVERLNDFHLSLPESEEFLRADLTKDSTKELAYAEQAHKKEDL